MSLSLLPLAKGAGKNQYSYRSNCLRQAAFFFAGRLGQLSPRGPGHKGRRRSTLLGSAFPGGYPHSLTTRCWLRRAAGPSWRGAWRQQAAAGWAWCASALPRACGRPQATKASKTGVPGKTEAKRINPSGNAEAVQVNGSHVPDTPFGPLTPRDSTFIC